MLPASPEDRFAFALELAREIFVRYSVVHRAGQDFRSTSHLEDAQAAMARAYKFLEIAEEWQAANVTEREP